LNRSSPDAGNSRCLLPSPPTHNARQSGSGTPQSLPGVPSSHAAPGHDTCAAVVQHRLVVTSRSTACLNRYSSVLANADRSRWYTSSALAMLPAESSPPPPSPHPRPARPPGCPRTRGPPPTPAAIPPSLRAASASSRAWSTAVKVAAPAPAPDAPARRATLFARHDGAVLDQHLDQLLGVEGIASLPHHELLHHFRDFRTLCRISCTSARLARFESGFSSSRVYASFPSPQLAAAPPAPPGRPPPAARRLAAAPPPAPAVQ